ncbi:hypothetical protein EYF80_057576 [Liparis tanakae]|uniref:Uncharacterized protein n=1 Tax=Liparis tanakae TaxID=230148 RepID=A0A4Z2EV79_9TELE|nr:hypothetical protein EYF80_057576 [Liparis tanakae]
MKETEEDMKETEEDMKETEEVINVSSYRESRELLSACSAQQPEEDEQRTRAHPDAQHRSPDDARDEELRSRRAHRDTGRRGGSPGGVRGAGCWRGGAGLLERGAGLLERGSGLPVRGAGLLERGAGLLERGAGCWRGGAGLLERGAGCWCLFGSSVP